MRKANFEGKFLSKLSKIDKQDIEGFLGHLVREKSFLEIIFNAMMDGVVVLRPSLEILYINDAAMELLNLAGRRRIVGNRIHEVFENRDLTELLTRFAIGRQPVQDVEVELSTPEPRWVAVSIIPLEADQGQAAGGAVVILRDASAARENEETRRRAERANTMATLAAGLAHEIKNPLNSLQIHAQLLQRALKDEKSRSKKSDRDRLMQASDIIVEEIQRLGHVVDEFLTAVRPTKPLFQRANINTHVERVGTMMRPEVESRGTRLTLSLDHDIPTVEFDPNQITQALLNLIKNSLDAVEGREDARIQIRTMLADSGYLISVSDNGRGIPEEQLKLILEPYYTTKFSGTGLGLAIVSRIVEEHGGKLDILSQPDKGTVITLAFPLETRPVRLLDQKGEG
ncbi:MAG: PAS domain-containing protein [Candidatus Sumerlaeaceae bacterium]|nr:PAS domain-containing protein [Candidatus Sumerlaeaceae bacterium]